MDTFNCLDSCQYLQDKIKEEVNMENYFELTYNDLNHSLDQEQNSNNFNIFFNNKPTTSKEIIKEDIKNFYNNNANMKNDHMNFEDYSSVYVNGKFNNNDNSSLSDMSKNAYVDENNYLQKMNLNNMMCQLNNNNIEMKDEPQNEQLLNDNIYLNNNNANSQQNNLQPSILQKNNTNITSKEDEETYSSSKNNNNNLKKEKRKRNRGRKKLKCTVIKNVNVNGPYKRKGKTVIDLEGVFIPREKHLNVEIKKNRIQFQQNHHKNIYSYCHLAPPYDFIEMFKLVKDFQEKYGFRTKKSFHIIRDDFGDMKIVTLKEKKEMKRNWYDNTVLEKDENDIDNNKDETKSEENPVDFQIQKTS